MGSGSDESESSDNEHWQIVNFTKRRITKPLNIQLRKRTTAHNGPSTSTNMFNLLQNDTNSDQQNNNVENNKNAEPKPPPIFIPDVGDMADHG